MRRQVTKTPKIYGVKQFKIGMNTLRSTSDNVLTRYLDSSHNVGGAIHITTSPRYRVCDSIGRYPSCFSFFYFQSNSVGFDMYLQYLCICYKIKEIYWITLPTTAWTASWGSGAFIVDGDFVNEHELLLDSQ